MINGLLLRVLPLVLTGISWVCLYGYGYYNGCAVTSNKYELIIQKDHAQYSDEMNEILTKLREKDQEMALKLNSIVKENMEQQERLQENYDKTIFDLRLNNIKLSGVLDNTCNNKATDNLSSKPTDTADIVCYKRTELYDKIEKSMAITTECDKIATDYNALLKVCKINME